MFLKIKLIAVLGLVMTAWSCTQNFEHWNTNPNEAPSISMEDLLKQMQNNIIPTQENAYQMSESLLGHVYGRYLTYVEPGKWAGVFSFFNAMDNWLNSPFNDNFSNCYGAWTMIKESTGGEGVIFQWAQILRVANMHRITDTYGPIPYNTMQTSVKLSNPYEPQDEVYKGMLDDLTEAINYISAYIAANPGDTYYEKFDVVYGGDLNKWVKFANSLKLRLAMRVVYADATLAEENAKQAVEHGIGVMESNSDNYWVTINRNPLYVMWDPYNDTRAAADIVSYMRGYSDPRIDKYFTPKTISGQTNVYGIRVGSSTSTAQGTQYSQPTTRENDPLLMMCAAETAFLKAEAAMRGWSWVGGSAEDFYNQGIRLSFEQWGAGDATAYINDDTSTQAAYVDPLAGQSTPAVSTITIKWANGTTEQMLERIITQKWIAMYPLGTEAWSEFRRTGYPRFFSTPVANVNNSDATLATRNASRIPYPPSEYETNSKNMPQALEYLGGSDNYSTRLWWDQKTGKPNW